MIGVRTTETCSAVHKLQAINHDQQHCYHYAPTIKPEAATAAVELLIMGVSTTETC
jgi:hypothetical protein